MARKSAHPIVSTESIYHYILIDKRREASYTATYSPEEAKKALWQDDNRGQIKNRVSIEERPAIVDTRERVGDWEMDLIIGRIGGLVLMTAVERKTRYTLRGLAPNNTAKKVKDCIIDVMRTLAYLVKTQTHDNGKEFAFHEAIAQALEASSYFAHPYHS